MVQEKVNNLPFVSVVIPAYNEEKLLPRCLSSLSELDYPRDRLEVIVVDNGSQDRTQTIAQSQGAVLLIDESRTVAGLRNIGAKNANGELLAFVDADCLVAADWLQKAVPYFHDPKTAAWGAPPEPPSPPTWVQSAWYLVRKKAEPVQAVEWLESMNLFVRKPLFDSLGGFNESLITCEDVDFCYRLHAHGRIVADAGIRVVHLGEAATVRDFIRKEIWRAKGNFQGIKSHGLSLKELPSLFIPLYFGGGIPLLFIFSLFILGATGLLVVAAFYVAPTGAVIWKIRKKTKDSIDILRLVLLLQVYFWTRTSSAFYLC